VLRTAACRALAPERNGLHFVVLRNTFNIGLELPLPLFYSIPLEILFDLVGGNVAHGVRKLHLGYDMKVNWCEKSVDET
jgi:hypothetical protein